MVLLGVEFLREQEQVQQFSDAMKDCGTLQTDYIILSPQGKPEVITRHVVSEANFMMEVQRDRTTMELKTPSELDMERFAGFASLASEISDVGKTVIPSAYGFNVESIYQQHSGANTLQYLGDRMSLNQVRTEGGWEFVGGLASLSYVSDEGRWNLKAEPRFNELDTDKVYLQLNLHRTDQKIPSREETTASINSVWQKIYDFAISIDRGI